MKHTYDNSEPKTGTIEEQLAAWGRQLDELRERSDEIGKDVIKDIERRYEALKSESAKIQEGSRKQARDIADQAGSASQRASESAGELGEGFRQAWLALSNSFNKAGESLQGNAQAKNNATDHN